MKLEFSGQIFRKKKKKKIQIQHFHEIRPVGAIRTDIPDMTRQSKLSLFETLQTLLKRGGPG
jgi:hypothetical protein